MLCSMRYGRYFSSSLDLLQSDSTALVPLTLHNKSNKKRCVYRKRSIEYCTKGRHGTVQAWLTRAGVHTLAPLPNPANQRPSFSAFPSSLQLQCAANHSDPLSPYYHRRKSTQHTTAMDSVKDAVGMGDNGPKTRTSYFPQRPSFVLPDADFRRREGLRGWPAARPLGSPAILGNEIARGRKETTPARMLGGKAC